MEDRRHAPRRQGERREFRRGTGRRDPEGRGRRRRLRQYLLPAAILLLPLALGAGYRETVSKPRADRARLAWEVSEQVRGVLAATSFPGLSFPGAAAPASVPPWSRPLTVPHEARQEFARACSRVPEEEFSFQDIPALGRAGALCALFLGDDQLARRRWARVAAVGAPEQVAEARVGLALLQIKAAVSGADTQDIGFALDRAEFLLSQAASTSAELAAVEPNLRVISELRSGASPREDSPGSDEAR